MHVDCFGRVVVVVASFFDSKMRRDMIDIANDVVGLFEMFVNISLCLCKFYFWLLAYRKVVAHLFKMHARD